MYTTSTWDFKLNPNQESKKLTINPIRFPREPPENRTMITEFLFQYPAPVYNPREDGSHNPGMEVIEDLAKQDEKSLIERSRKHGLLDEGSKWDMVKRLWRHYRADVLKLGFPYYGYGLGFERVLTPVCACGNSGPYSKKIPRFPRKDDSMKRFPRTVRFPRTTQPTRFPRLPDGDPRAKDPIFVLKLLYVKSFEKEQ